MIRIDKNKCVSCGLCVRDCLSGVLRMEADGPRVYRSLWCNRCSHCLAVCPTGAIVHKGLGGKATRPVQRKRLQPKVYAEIVRSRRSVRHYRSDPVSKELIHEILDLARYAPTASNAQNVSYTVVRNPELLKHLSDRLFRFGDRFYRLLTHASFKRVRSLLSHKGPVAALQRYIVNWEHYRNLVSEGRDLLFHGAPVLILVHADRGATFARDNCLIAATNIANHAHALGLGTCFVGLLLAAMRLDRSLARSLRVPKGQKVHAALTLGYPAFQHSHHVYRKAAHIHWDP